MTPDVEEESDDVTIQFGDDGGGGSDDMFMGSEFDDIDGGSEALGGDEGGEAWNFQVELDNLLDECAERGYEDPEIAFCSSTSQIDDVELRLPPDETDAEEAEETEHGLPLPASRSTLLDMLEEQYEGEADGERVGFVPMHRTGDGYQRVLALIARPGGPVLSTLDSMQDQTLSRAPQTRLLDAEVSLYLGLARSVLQLPPGTPEKTIFVRSGTDDTLVLFIEGNTLRQSEHLPELTAEDSAETICSRVLLLQDEYGMGQVQHLMLVAEEDEEVLASAFKSYFSTAELHVLRSHLPGGDDTDAEAYVGATGAALRLLDDAAFAPHFQPVNLLAKEYVPSRLRLPVGWPVPAMLTLLAIATLGFVWLYFVNASTISEKRTALRALEQKVNQVDQEALQRRIDSMKAMTTEYAAANKTIGGLLQGSNKWSSGLATVTGQMNDLRGLTINQWSPQSGTEVTILGRSNDRSKVVELAQRLDGRILGLTFTETRDVSLYDFELTVPLDTTKPEAIEYWREQRGEQLAAGTEAVDVGPDAPRRIHRRRPGRPPRPRRAPARGRLPPRRRRSRPAMRRPAATHSTRRRSGRSSWPRCSKARRPRRRRGGFGSSSMGTPIRCRCDTARKTVGTGSAWPVRLGPECPRNAAGHERHPPGGGVAAQNDGGGRRSRFRRGRRVDLVRPTGRGTLRLTDPPTARTLSLLTWTTHVLARLQSDFAPHLPGPRVRGGHVPHVFSPAGHD
jgi:hypothetical protein